MSASPQPRYRCHDCKSASVNPRNLAVFIDGTSNKPGPEKTNVMKLFGVVPQGKGYTVEQHAFYLKGIGARDVDDLPLSSYLPKVIYTGCEMAIALNAEKNVKEAYRWLAEQYREGDQIYLFGFSRGAYQVRALSGMIHEVGLLWNRTEEQIEQAYCCYLSINPNDPTTNQSAVDFKKAFCRPGVRIHFIGVWDTVSSLGLVKQDVHITSSSSLNPCHFRHALALDERRVKFMAEYFMEVNAHRGKIRSPRYVANDSDVKEVWFAGCHADVGGTSKPHTEVAHNPAENDHFPVHAGNVPLLWMGREAAANGLVSELEGFPWWPEDIDLGRGESMNWFWRIFEVARVRHQVSFSGTGKHEKRRHWFRPRLVIPGQQIHLSVFAGNMYTPRATLACGIEIPTASQKASDGLWPTAPWTTELASEEATMHLLELLLCNQQKTLQSLEEVLLLLNLRLENNHTRAIPTPEWLKASVLEQPECDMDKFALTVIHDVISNSSTPEEPVKATRDSLRAILSSPDRLDFPRALYVLRFSARHPTLRRRFIAHDDVIDALVPVLERIAEGRGKNVFPLVMDSLCYLISDESQRINVINKLASPMDTGKTRLSLAFDVKEPNHLMASLKMIASLAQHQPSHCEALKPKIIDLAKKGTRSSVGRAAVEVLVALNVPLPDNIHISNVLGYLGSTLPPLDAEIDSASSPSEIVNLPPVFRGNGSGAPDEKVVRKLLSTIGSSDDHQRTAATLTLLKLCNNPNIRNFCSQNRVLDIFMKQLKRKETSLLAAYALNTCLKLKMWTSNDFPRVAELIVGMVDNGWFDDAVGRVEGSKIFRELMMSGDLWQQVINRNIVATLEKKLESCNHHEIRISLICLEILWTRSPADLERTVTASLTLLGDKDVKNRKRGIKALSSLAQTEAGEQAIMPYVDNIVRMLLPSNNGLPPSRDQLFGCAAALYDLCKNATLREHIQQSDGYNRFKALRRNSMVYPQTR